MTQNEHLVHQLDMLHLNSHHIVQESDDCNPHSTTSISKSKSHTSVNPLYWSQCEQYHPFCFVECSTIWLQNQHWATTIVDVNRLLVMWENDKSLTICKAKYRIAKLLSLREAMFAFGHGIGDWFLWHPIVWWPRNKIFDNGFVKNWRNGSRLEMSKIWFNMIVWKN